MLSKTFSKYLTASRRSATLNATYMPFKLTAMRAAQFSITTEHYSAIEEPELAVDSIPSDTFVYTILNNSNSTLRLLRFY